MSKLISIRAALAAAMLLGVLSFDGGMQSSAAASEPIAQPSAVAGSRFVPRSPTRIFDSREVVRGRPAGKVFRSTNAYFDNPFIGQFFDTTYVTGYLVNLTVTSPDTDGFVTLQDNSTPLAWPPVTSSINFVKNETRANFVVVPSSSVAMWVQTNTTVDVVIDWFGYFSNNPAVGNTGSYYGINPFRLLDTRPSSLLADFSNGFVGPITGGTSVVVDPTLAMTPFPGESIGYLVLSVTGVDARGPGYITAYEGSRPNTSNLNFGVGDVTSNMVIVPYTSALSFYSFATAHLVVDVLGYFRGYDFQPSDDLYYPVTSSRILDTRDGSGLPGAGVAIYGPGYYDFVIDGRGGLPADGSVITVIGNATVIPETDTFVRIWSSDAPAPPTSNINARIGKPTPGSVWADVTNGGTVRSFLNGRGRLLFDVGGYFG